MFNFILDVHLLMYFKDKNTPLSKKEISTPPPKKKIPKKRKKKPTTETKTLKNPVSFYHFNLQLRMPCRKPKQ